MVLNALVHRNYMGPMIQMRVYDDKITLGNLGQLPDSLTAEGLTQFHASYPRNPLIAGACFKATLIDSWGSGISKIMTACKNEGLPKPRFEAFGGGVLVTLFRPMDAEEEGDDNAQKHVEKDLKHVEKTSTKTSTKTGTKTGTKIRDKILKIIEKEPSITIKKIMFISGLSKNGVMYHIDSLKADEIIKRVGGNKGGHWEIIGNENNK